MQMALGTSLFSHRRRRNPRTLRRGHAPWRWPRPAGKEQFVLHLVEPVEVVMEVLGVEKMLAQLEQVLTCIRW
jgi:hypothetical protein